MIKCDIGNQAGSRFECIHRVEAAAHANLEHGYIDSARRKYQHRGQCAVLEIGQRSSAAHGFDALECSHDLLVGRGLASDGDPFIELDNMRR